MNSTSAQQKSERQYIVKFPNLKRSQDYAFLREEGIKLIEKLGHQFWTDYNMHDPGITLLELLCYAITDLGYRTDYNIKDLLSSYRDGVTVNDTDFHTAREILTSSAVTFDDLRKVLIDIHGVRNAWIEPHCSVKYCLNRPAHKLSDCPESISDAVSSEPIAPLNGLYDVFIEFENFVTQILETPAVPGDGGFIPPASKGISFDVTEGLYLESVSVFVNMPGQFNIRLVDRDGVVLKEFPANVANADEKTPIILNIFIPAGNQYRLEAHDGTAGLRLYSTTNPSFPYSLEKQLILTGGTQNGTPLNSYFFFYDWQIRHLPRANSTTVSCRDVLEAVRQRLHRHRNLCEDFINICDLKIEEVAVCADIETEPGADLAEIMAELFYRLELHVSPAVNFCTIEELVDRGNDMEKVFEGPILDHGFIDDDEFRAIRRRCEIRASDVINIIMAIPLVKTVKHIALLSFIEGKLHLQENWLLALTMEQGRIPKFSADRSKIVFYKNNLPYFASREQASVLLKELKAGELRSKLKQHQNDLPVPVGEDREPADYYPIQNELPATYRVGNIKVEASKPALRKAQSKQLKAYLMFFEQLLTNYLAQLANVRELFSWQEGTTISYFSQIIKQGDIRDLYDVFNHEQIREFFPADKRTPDPEVAADPVAALEADLTTALQLMAEDSNTAEERKGRFLDHLAGRFCESFTDYSLLMFNLFKEDAASRINGDKKIFLKEYPVSSRNRGQGYNYCSPARENSAVVGDQRIFWLEGMPGAEGSASSGYRLVVYKMPGDTSRWRFVLKDNAQKILFQSSPRETEREIDRLMELTLAIGCDEGNYHHINNGAAHELRYQGDDEIIGTTLGRILSSADLEPVVNYFANYAKRGHLSGYQRRVYGLLGIRDLRRRDLAGHRFAIEPFDDDGVEQWRFVLKNEAGDNIFESIICEAKSDIKVLLDLALGIGGDSENYQLDQADSRYELMRPCEDATKRTGIGHTTDQEVWNEVQGYFNTYGESEGFHVIEHLLLRKRTLDDPFMPVQLQDLASDDPEQCGCVSVVDPYSFRMTLVLPSWPRRFNDMKFRRFVEETLRREAPAHVFTKICWVSHAQMAEFETVYNTWAGSLAMLTPGSLTCRNEQTSEELFPLTGELPLPGTEDQHQVYSQALKALINKLHGLVTVYPLARLHGCSREGGDDPAMTLDNSTLGTL